MMKKIFANLEQVRLLGLQSQNENAENGKKNRLEIAACRDCFQGGAQSAPEFFDTPLKPQSSGV